MFLELPSVIDFLFMMVACDLSFWYIHFSLSSPLEQSLPDHHSEWCCYPGLVFLTWCSSDRCSGTAPVQQHQDLLFRDLRLQPLAAEPLESSKSSPQLRGFLTCLRYL